LNFDSIECAVTTYRSGILELPAPDTSAAVKSAPGASGRISASWEAQIAGREIGGPSPLNLADFSRQRARIVMEFEF
jgi:hypothetical protein